MAILLDGKQLRAKKYVELTKRVEALKGKGIQPHLVVIQVGENPASKVYVKHKQLACDKLGIKSTKIHLDENIEWEELVEVTERLNNDNDVDGILVQFPLPKKFAGKDMTTLVSAKKDADGFHPFNQGVNLTASNIFAPKSCTPNGVMEFFKEYKIELSGKDALIIGRSNIVGRPMQYLLEHANATTSVAHSRTKKETLNDLVKKADIIVLATGQKDLITPEMVKDGVIIIDVGIIRTPEGKLRGDILYKDFMDVASYITPVPGGVGPMTVTMLMENVIALAEVYR